MRNCHTNLHCLAKYKPSTIALVLFEIPTLAEIMKLMNNVSAQTICICFLTQLHITLFEPMYNCIASADFVIQCLLMLIIINYDKLGDFDVGDRHGGGRENWCKDAELWTLVFGLVQWPATNNTINHKCLTSL